MTTKLLTDHSSPAPSSVHMTLLLGFENMEMPDVILFFKTLLARTAKGEQAQWDIEADLNSDMTLLALKLTTNERSPSTGDFVAVLPPVYFTSNVNAVLEKIVFKTTENDNAEH